VDARSVSLLVEVVLLFACPITAWLLVRHTVRGVKRGWFMRRDGVTRLRREASPRAFAFEVVALAAMVVALAGLGVRAAVRVFAALG